MRPRIRRVAGITVLDSLRNSSQYNWPPHHKGGGPEAFEVVQFNLDALTAMRIWPTFPKPLSFAKIDGTTLLRHILLHLMLPLCQAQTSSAGHRKPTWCSATQLSRSHTQTVRCSARCFLRTKRLRKQSVRARGSVKRQVNLWFNV